MLLRDPIHERIVPNRDELKFALVSLRLDEPRRTASIPRRTILAVLLACLPVDFETNTRQALGVPLTEVCEVLHVVLFVQFAELMCANMFLELCQNLHRWRSII